MILIVGAGITGLSFASFLKENDDYLIIESDNQVGGYCKTIKKDGFVWDYSGHFFHFKDEKIKEYLLERMDTTQIINCKKNTQIYYKGRYIDFPFQKNIHQLEKQEFIDCLYDLFDPKSMDENTFKDMVYNRFGKAIAEKFLVPYNEKLYACDLDKLDKDAMGRFFPYVEKEDIIRNFKNPNNTSYNTYFTYPQGGAIEYVNSLLTRIDTQKIALNESLISVDLENKVCKTNKRTIKYSKLISTIPFPFLLDKVNLKYNKEDYTYNKVLVFNLGFDSKGEDVKNNWVYFPEKDFRFYRVGYYDNIFSTNRMSLYVEIGFNSDEKINEKLELEKVLSDLEKAKIKSPKQKLICYSSIVMSPAYVHINSKNLSEIQKIKESLALKNVYSIGRYGSWTYCSIEDNIIEAKNLLDKIN